MDWSEGGWLTSRKQISGATNGESEEFHANAKCARHSVPQESQVQDGPGHIHNMKEKRFLTYCSYS